MPGGQARQVGNFQTGFVAETALLNSLLVEQDYPIMRKFAANCTFSLTNRAPGRYPQFA